MRVHHYLARARQLYGPREAVVDGARRFTYSEFAGRCHQLARALAALGVGPGDRVGIVSPNTHYFLEAFFGVACLGAVIVPLNYRLIGDDFQYSLDHAGARVVLADDDLRATVDEIRDRLPSVEHYVVAGPPASGWLDWEELLSGHSTDPLPDPDRQEDDLVSINYTSGTTARPKGVMLTHANFVTNAYNFISHFGISHHDTALWTLPMFHCNGWGGVYALTGMGARQVIIRAPEGEAIFRAVAEENVTFACMAPIVLGRILDFERAAEFSLKTRPRIVVAGAPPPVAYVRRLEQELGWTFHQIYGLTETSPIITVAELRPHLEGDPYVLKARAGQPALGAEIRVVDSHGPVACDDQSVGEVTVRGRMVFAGYWRQPEATAAVMKDGFFHTGDLATVDASGSINIVDRAKDVIISGGENISSIEVEDTLYHHPGVLEAAVIGVPDDKWGETPLAVIVPRPGVTLKAEDLRAYCREHMAHFKVPHLFEFRQALPRTATGKLKKFELREPYWGNSQRRVH